MTVPRRFLILLCTVVMAVAACGWPALAPTPGVSVRDSVSTQVMQTLQAMTQQADTPTPTNTPLPVVTPTWIVFPAAPTLTVSAPTDCYSGPGSTYGYVVTVNPGMIVAVVGRYPPDDFWIVKVPGYENDLCWLPGGHALVTGDTSNLPVPATPEESKYTLGEPRSLGAACYTDGSRWTIVLTWANTDPNQTGLLIYRNGNQIAALSGRAKTFTDHISQRRLSDVLYGVQAISADKISSIVSVRVRKCD